MVAVGSGVRQHVGAVVAHLHRQRVSMGVGGDRKKPVGPGIATAPDLFAVRWCAPHQGQAGIGVVWLDDAPRWPSVSRRLAIDARRVLVTVGSTLGHHPGASNRPSPMASRPGHPVGGRRIEDKSLPVVSVSLARTAKGHVHRGRHHVEHSVQQRPGVHRQGASRPISLCCCDRRQFGDEAVIFEGHLSIDAARESVFSASSRSRTLAASPPQRALSVNQSKASAATRRPAASAMTWLLADDPRLRNDAR